MTRRPRFIRPPLPSGSAVAVTLFAAVAAACSDGVLDVAPPMEPSAADQPTAQAEAQEVRFAPGQVIAMFEPGSNVAAGLGPTGATVTRGLPFGLLLLSVARGRELTVAQALARNPNVRFAEPNWIHTLEAPCALGVCVEPTDAFFQGKWDLHNDGDVNNSSGGFLASTGAVDADIDWLEAHHLLGPFTGSATIGMLDSGINGQHQEFAGRILAARNFHDDPFFPQPGGPDPLAWADDSGHGSHTTGIAAAAGNDGLGIPGVAYGPNIRIVVAKVCGPILLGLLYGCTEAAIIDALAWAVAEGADVVNLSLGGTQASAGEQTALAQTVAAGTLPVCAAGNDGGPVNFPAAFPECLAVSATDWGDDLASYSSRGAEVELAAPGGDDEHPDGFSFVLSAWIGGPAEYRLAAGTSMATPEVAGLATLLHALGVTGVQQKIDLMKSTADDLGPPGSDPDFGAGRINAHQAVAAALGAPPPPPPPPQPNQPPVAAFSFTCADLTCQFTDESTDDRGIAARTWDFGDGNGSSLVNPSHTYGGAGTYTVELTVEDTDGEVAAISEPVTVTDPPPPPSGFTLTAKTRRKRGLNVTALSWTPKDIPVDVYRAVVGEILTTRIAAGILGGRYVDETGSQGSISYFYFVCDSSDPNNCSNLLIVNF